MKATVIGEIYNSFSISEIKELDLYLNTSHWQYSDTVIRCHQCLMHYHIHNILEELDKNILYKAVYEEEAYNDSKLRFLLNRVAIAIKEYIVIREFKKENIFTDKLWLDFLLKHRLKKNLQYHIEKEKTYETSEYRYLGEYFKSQEVSQLTFQISKDVKKQFESINNVMQGAELFSDLVFIKNYCSLISFTNVYQSLPFELPRAKLQEIKDKKWNELYPDFAVYLSLLDLLILDTDEAYFLFKKTLFKNFEIWSDEEKINFLTYLPNYCTKQINKGNMVFMDELYGLFAYMDKKKYFQIPGYLNVKLFNNIVHIYLRKAEIEKANSFLGKYLIVLEESTQESCLHFNQARIHHENKKYKESLRELLQVDFGEDQFYSLNSKFLLLKNYYELNESDAFASLCASFKSYIRKNKVVSETYKLYCLNFIKYTQKVYGSTPTKKKKILIEIESESKMAEKAWLLQKAAP